MTDEEAVTAFIRTNRTAAQRFFDALRSIIQTIKEALGGERTLAQAERFWKRAFEKAEANENAAEAGGGVMFSLSKTKIERLSSIIRAMNNKPVEKMAGNKNNPQQTMPNNGLPAPEGDVEDYGNDTTNTSNVNRDYSYKSDYEDYLNALEQDEEGTKSNFASLEENAPPEREEADGFDEVYEYLMDENLEQYDREHEDKLNALAESEAPEETAPPTITRKDLDKYLYDYYDPI